MAMSARSLALLGGLAVVLAACSGSSTGDDASSKNQGRASAALSLQGDGDKLVLNGSPKDKSYQATYPNPFHVSKMDVSLDAKGKLIPTCDGGGDGCSETPFETHVTIQKDTLAIEVVDIHGVVVWELNLDLPKEARASLASKLEDGGTKDDSSGDSTEDESYPESGDSSPSDGSGGGDDCGKAAYCAAINSRLADGGIDYRIDCASVSDSFEIGVSLPKDFTKPVRCRDYLGDTPDQGGFECTMKQMNWEQNARRLLIEGGVCTSSPIVLDLGGKGIQLSSIADGRTFDLLGTGAPVKSAWVRGDTALLAIDKNENGRIDDATELFGNVTNGTTHADGYAALAEYDDNGDGMIDAKDRVFSHLVLWKAASSEGVGSARGELISLADAGIVRLEILPISVKGPSSIDSYGNEIPLTSQFVWRDGRRGAMADAWLRFR